MTAETTLTITGADDKPVTGDPMKIAHSDKIELAIDVTGRTSGVIYMATLKHGEDTKLSNADLPAKYPIASANKAEHGGAWTATVKASDGTELAPATANFEIVAQPAEAAAPTTPPPGVYDRGFTRAIGAVIAVVFVVLIAVMIGVLADRQTADVPIVWVLAFSLFTVGVLLAAVGAFLVALEVRGTLVAAKDKDALSERGVDLKDAATLVDAVGKLRGVTAVLLLAAVCLVSSAWIGYGSTRPDSPANPPPTTEPT